jgi:hypothetical protein
MHSGTAGVVHHVTVLVDSSILCFHFFPKYPACAPSGLACVSFISCPARSRNGYELPFSHAEPLPTLENKHPSRWGSSVRSHSKTGEIKANDVICGLTVPKKK